MIFTGEKFTDINLRITDPHRWSSSWSCPTIYKEPKIQVPRGE